MRRMQTPWTRTVRMLILAGVLSLSSLALAQEHPLPDCTEASLSGPYAYSRTGTVVGQGPAAANGVVTFDGQGNLLGTDTASVNGTITARDFKGEYKVAPDCTGTATFVFSDREIVNLDLQIIAGAQAVQFIQTDAGTVITGAAKAQSHARHSAAATTEVHLQQPPEALGLRRPVDRPPRPGGGQYCNAADFASCRATCGIVGQSCFVCAIADDGHPVFYCR